MARWSRGRGIAYFRTSVRTIQAREQYRCTAAERAAYRKMALVNRHRPTALALAATLVFLGFGPAGSRIQAAPYPPQTAVTWKMPDLAVVAPFDFRIEYSKSNRRLLRFSTVIVNLGAGPFQLSGY